MTLALVALAAVMGTPVFPPYDDLRRDERRILASSAVRVLGRERSGRELYAALGDRRPLALANCLDQTAVLANHPLPDGSQPIDHVLAVERFGFDRLWARCDGALVTLVGVDPVGTMTHPLDIHRRLRARGLRPSYKVAR